MRRWLGAHLRAFADAASRFRRAPLGSAATLLALGSALGLPLFAYLLLATLADVADRYGGSPQITLYLDASVGSDGLPGAAEAIGRRTDVARVRPVPKEHSLRDLAGVEDMAELLDGLERNPLPDAIVVTPNSRDPGAVGRLRDELAEVPGVTHAQLDSEWVTRLSALVGAGEAALGLLAGLLALGVVATTFNTIRLQVLSRAEEIEVAALVGATRPFLRRPFLYFGALQGLGAGIVAIVIAYLCRGLMQAKTGALLEGIGFSPLAPLAPGDAVSVAAFATVLGWLGAWVSVSRHMGEGEPSGNLRPR